MRYENMLKVDLIEKLREFDSYDEEVRALGKVLAAVAELTPKTYDTDYSKEVKRGRMQRVFRHVAARYGVTL